ncbi:hypothetical protein N7532_002791 [Penicillium argentinense]|uniref:PrpF protein n=1 Tax=Penicillium argentinense TaxID=1131581 RepID=A0A9W9KLJ5_9EURO|nr:uncharacterized protein N7532_002791 [Penicillium argentinense]KAJ5110146.1 hypothetical protein N7532_002791 [Penicillium argentinense]
MQATRKLKANMTLATHLDQFVSPIICPTRRKIPGVWMRSGTSKGLFLHERDLPPSTKAWESILLSAMGSVQANSRQVNGIGGATSTTSKVAIVSKSKRPSIDVDYTFVQVAPDQPRIDMTGNCGNIASGVGPFSLDEGLVTVQPGQSNVDIRIFNTNTRQTIVETVHVGPDGRFREDGVYELAGVEGRGSPIKVAFLNPEGSMTESMFPSGFKSETMAVSSLIAGKFSVRASLVDAANPFVLVDASSLPFQQGCPWPNVKDSDVLSVVEEIRRQGAVRFGLAPDMNDAGRVRGTPKIAFLSAVTGDEARADIEVLSFSLGKPHPSLQLTGAVCIAAAMAVHGTVAWELAGGKKTERMHKHGMAVDGQEIAAAIPVGIRHPSGVIETETVLGVDSEGEACVQQVAVFRTARRLFEGNVFY